MGFPGRWAVVNVKAMLMCTLNFMMLSHNFFEFIGYETHIDVFREDWKILNWDKMLNYKNFTKELK